MSWPVNHSPLDTMYSGDRLETTEENSSNFSSMGYFSPSSSLMSTKRCSMVFRSDVQSTWYSMWAFTRRSRSVSLLSPLKRLPAADTTMNLRSGSAFTMDLTFLNWLASATLEPPNLDTLIMC